jgi:hypothetical protein
MYQLGLALLPASHLAAQSLPYRSMARRIADALQVTAGERVLLRVDPATMAPLAPAVRSLLEARGAVVDALPYGPSPDFAARLTRTDIYLWLPTRAPTPLDQTRALERWLDNDYRQLTRRMDDAIRRLRAGEVRVTTPHGTDIRFRVGGRPFNKQDGDASKARARAGRIRIDRHVELPAGVLRGGVVRWLFFPDATVRVGADVIVRDGKLRGAT